MLTSHLCTTRSLKDLNFAISLQIQLPICLSCRSVVLAEWFASHIKDHHQIFSKHCDLKLIENILKQFALRRTHPIFCGLPLPSIDGLEVRDGFSCAFCPSLYLNVKSLREHCREVHPYDEFVVRQVVRSQRLSNFHKALFPVVEGVQSLREVDSEKSILSSLETELENSQRKFVGEEDVRNISPWLRATKWDQYLKGADMSALRELAHGSTSVDFPALKKSVMHLFESCQMLIGETSILSLQKLNSPDPQKR
jgi:Orsellinic acid/F9775 biosynthesis cluster protein D